MGRRRNGVRERLHDAGLIDYCAGDVHGMRYVEAIKRYLNG